MLVAPNKPINFNYPTEDLASGLVVRGFVYDVTSGSAVFLSNAGMINAANGVYVGTFTPSQGKRYLIIGVVFTDLTYSTPDNTRAPVAFNFECEETDTSSLNFNYGAYDQGTSLYMGASIFDMSSGSPVLIGSPIAMAHVAYGVYYLQYQGKTGKDYHVSKLSYTTSGLTVVDTSRPPGAETLQCYAINTQQFSAPSQSNTDPVTAAMEGLQAYLITNVAGLTVLDEWPYANQKLNYPSATLTRGKPKRTPQMIYQLSQTSPDMNNKIVVTELVAQYESMIQIDLWARTKLERTQFTDMIVDSINAQEVDGSGQNKPDGLSLQLSNYFNTYARFEIETSEVVDDEAGAQRQERRQRIVLIMNVDEIRQRTYYAITNVGVYVGAQQGGELTDDTADTEEFSDL